MLKHGVSTKSVPTVPTDARITLYEFSAVRTLFHPLVKLPRFDVFYRRAGKYGVRQCDDKKQRAVELPTYKTSTFVSGDGRKYQSDQKWENNVFHVVTIISTRSTLIPR